MTSGSQDRAVILTVLYDGECRLCLATVERLRQLRTKSEIRYVPVQQMNMKADMLPPAANRIPHSELLAQLHVVDEEGLIFGGSEAVLRLLKDTTSLGWLGKLGSLPGLRGATRALYRLIARYRYDLFGKTDSCADGTCRLPERQSENGGSKK